MSSARVFISNLLFILIGLQFLLATTKASELMSPRAAEQWNVTTSTEDYILQNQKQYNATVAEQERQLSEFGAVYLAKFVPLDIQISLLEDKLDLAENELAPLELLNPLSKHCVRKYRWQLPNKAVVTTKLNTCVNSGKNQLTSILGSPTSNKNTLANYYNNNLNTNLRTCKTKNPNSSQNYTNCVTTEINSANAYTLNNKKAFASNLHTSECTAGTSIDTAVQCSFNILYSTIGSIHETLYAVDTCIANNANNPECYNVVDNSARMGCPNIIDLALDQKDFRNATIHNPFYGLKNVKCLQVNFI